MIDLKYILLVSGLLCFAINILYIKLLAKLARCFTIVAIIVIEIHFILGMIGLGKGLDVIL